MRRRAGDVASIEADPATIWIKFTLKLRNQCRLAGAVRTNKRVSLIRHHIEIEIIGRDQAREALVEATN